MKYWRERETYQTCLQISIQRRRAITWCRSCDFLVYRGLFQSVTELTDFSDTHKVDDFKYMNETDCVKNKNVHVLNISLSNWQNLTLGRSGSTKTADSTTIISNFSKIHYETIDFFCIKWERNVPWYEIDHCLTWLSSKMEYFTSFHPMENEMYPKYRMTM